MPKPLLVAFAVFLLLMGAVFGFMVGGNKSQPRWQPTPATVHAAEHHAEFEGASFTYAFTASVAWIDEGGTFHADGWPACLDDHTTSATILVPGRGADVDGHEIRPVYAVDCRGR